MSADERLVALIDDLIAAPAETSWLEFKVDNWEHQRIASLISAISNSARLADRLCGYVVWGIENETHAVVGTRFQFGREKAKGQPTRILAGAAHQSERSFFFCRTPSSKRAACGFGNSSGNASPNEIR
jgi:hypothetical protein